MKDLFEIFSIKFEKLWKIHFIFQDFYMKFGLITQGKFVIFYYITNESLFGNYSGSLIEFQSFDQWILWDPFTY